MENDKNYIQTCLIRNEDVRYMTAFQLIFDETTYPLVKKILKILQEESVGAVWVWGKETERVKNVVHTIYMSPSIYQSSYALHESKATCCVLTDNFSSDIHVTQLLSLSDPAEALAGIIGVMIKVIPSLLPPIDGNDYLFITGRSQKCYIGGSFVSSPGDWTCVVGNVEKQLSQIHWSGTEACAIQLHCETLADSQNMVSVIRAIGGFEKIEFGLAGPLDKNPIGENLAAYYLIG